MIFKLKEDNFEDELEKLYWEFDDKRNKKSFSERDCFKMSIRNLFNKYKLIKGRKINE